MPNTKAYIYRDIDSSETEFALKRINQQHYELTLEGSEMTILLMMPYRRWVVIDKSSSNGLPNLGFNYTNPTFEQTLNEGCLHLLKDKLSNEQHLLSIIAADELWDNLS